MGKLRTLGAAEQPPQVGESFADHTVSRTEPDGEVVTIQDAGDILLVLSLPFRVERRDPSSNDVGVTWAVPTQTALRAHLDQVRLAFLLCDWQDRPPVLLPVCQRLSEPVTGTGGVSWSDPRYSAPGRTPTRLSEEQCDEWRSWISALDGDVGSHLGAAPTRLLRAFTEPRQSVDALIDAVIVWEALFGTATEVTFRVTASMARLLTDETSNRAQLQKRAAEIYGLRSRLVHGEEANAQEIGSASTEALGLAIDIMCTVLSERSDLVPLKSAERSRRLLLE